MSFLLIIAAFGIFLHNEMPETSTIERRWLARLAFSALCLICGTAIYILG